MYNWLHLYFHNERNENIKCIADQSSSFFSLTHSIITVSVTDFNGTPLVNKPVVVVLAALVAAQAWQNNQFLNTNANNGRFLG